MAPIRPLISSSPFSPTHSSWRTSFCDSTSQVSNPWPAQPRSACRQQLREASAELGGSDHDIAALRHLRCQPRRHPPPQTQPESDATISRGKSARLLEHRTGVRGDRNYTRQA